MLEPWEVARQRIIAGASGVEFRLPDRPRLTLAASNPALPEVHSVEAPTRSTGRLSSSEPQPPKPRPSLRLVKG